MAVAVFSWGLAKLLNARVVLNNSTLTVSSSSFKSEFTSSTFCLYWSLFLLKIIFFYNIAQPVNLKLYPTALPCSLHYSLLKKYYDVDFKGSRNSIDLYLAQGGLWSSRNGCTQCFRAYCIMLNFIGSIPERNIRRTRHHCSDKSNEEVSR